MSTIYISETGDDALDGSTPETAIRSWRRAITLARGNSELHLMDVRTMERLTREIENQIGAKFIPSHSGVSSAGIAQRSLLAQCFMIARASAAAAHRMAERP